ncbi:hypothetical protein SISNIDRAFT_498577 [Sistotremastrum niveocremeum HHB9708]|uniref:Zn(2)-C6 fungal-type domain-containing protein n=2 Tax=Sistotremastraceae TaxID=3402574 RepID=A0A164MWC1_9AGAM|nr:hypothetical protein SISNIDRAFT_498577 [Sistotremastrum niveocremeum HHB9708]KZT32297.1 hypothetical protein SISSUDRAFT_1123484 [Sistotremastrum suecicum HHB10207 ss-3]
MSTASDASAAPVLEGRYCTKCKKTRQACVRLGQSGPCERCKLSAAQCSYVDDPCVRCVERDYICIREPGYDAACERCKSAKQGCSISVHLRRNPKSKRVAAPELLNVAPPKRLRQSRTSRAARSQSKASTNEEEDIDEDEGYEDEEIEPEGDTGQTDSASQIFPDGNLSSHSEVRFPTEQSGSEWGLDQTMSLFPYRQSVDRQPIKPFHVMSPSAPLIDTQKAATDAMIPSSTVAIMIQSMEKVYQDKAQKSENSILERAESAIRAGSDHSKRSFSFSMNRQKSVIDDSDANLRNRFAEIEASLGALENNPTVGEEAKGSLSNIMQQVKLAKQVFDGGAMMREAEWRFSERCFSEAVEFESESLRRLRE